MKQSPKISDLYDKNWVRGHLKLTWWSLRAFVNVNTQINMWEIVLFRIILADFLFLKVPVIIIIRFGDNNVLDKYIYIYIYSCNFEQVWLDIQKLAHLKLFDEIYVL